MTVLSQRHSRPLRCMITFEKAPHYVGQRFFFSIGTA
jgi:hypothetical protein